MKQCSVSGLFFVLLSLLAVIARSQATGNYERQWKKVDSLIRQQLPQSALAEIKKIYTLAKKEKQETQVIKALVYMTDVQEDTREDNTLLSIREIEAETATGSEPVRAIVNSLLAERYWNYYQSHRWTLYNRTQTVDFKKEDIATWAAEDFHKKISTLYLQSIRNEKLLQQTRLEPYDAVILKGNMRHLRPTLFDLLAHRALAYFINDERDINKPAYAFEIDQAAAFDPAADFIHHRFVTKDSLSLYHKALLIYQQLLAFHLNDAKPDALIDADLQRLEFVREKSVHPDKDQLYLAAITHIAHQYENMPAASQAWYLLASYYEEKASQYKPYGDSTHQYDRVKARDICVRVLSQRDSSEGKINCYNLLNQINSKSLEFNLEKVNVPGQPFRVLVQYRNFTNLYLRVVRVDDKLKKALVNTNDEAYWSSIITAPVLKYWKQALPVTIDLLQHSTEIKIDALPTGEYLLVASADADLADPKTLIGARRFYVSNISFVNNGDDFFVLHRDNGQPLANAAVEVWEQRYDYKISKSVREKTETYQTNANGFFHRDKKKDPNQYYSNYFLNIVYGNERLFMDELINDYYYYRSNEPELKPVTSIFFFTDRSLYRPGQTVYFKGIVLSTSSLLAEKKNEILPGYTTTVYLRDANSQLVDSLKLTTNEYGSISGKFQLPATGLNGTFSLFTKKESAYVSFRMEEYKRPKFYVDYEPVKGTYKVNDKIKVTGFAKAYAGNNIDGATVRYRVVRKPRFVYPWLFARWWQQPSEPMEIVHGEVKTDKDGKFIVEFTAIPDGKIEKKFEPVFDYTVYADITDINGETRSGEQSVSVSYKSLLLKVDLPTAMPADSLKTLSIRTENMNGQFEPAMATVTITRLHEEKRLIRPRYWERPDQFVMSKEEYIRNFPYDEYNNESTIASWEKAEKVREATDSIRENQAFRLAGSGLANGFYVVEITATDNKGDTIKDTRYLQLYDNRSDRLSSPQYLWTMGADPIEPGEKTSVQLGTTADNLFVVQQTEKKKGSPVYSFAKLDQQKKSFEFTATEADRGGYGASWLFVKHNRFFQYGQTIEVPWTNKELAIEYGTYRNKTLPGSEEKWKLKISGYKNEKVAAELLAAMYDASLDQFYPHNWYKPGIWPSYYNTTSWKSEQDFTAVASQARPDNAPEPYQYYVKQYDRLRTGIYDIIDDEASPYAGNFAKPRAMFIGKNAPVAQALAGRARGVQVEEYANTMSFQHDMNQNVRFKADTTPVYSLIDPTKIERYVVNNVDGSSFSLTLDQVNQQNVPVQVRKNFNETAFFFPELRTDSNGNIEFSFTLPEALTKWKFQALAHTKGLAFGHSTTEIITQKQLMVQPNAPRFLREGDRMEFSSKIVNLSDKELTGQAELQLLDAATNQPVDGWFQNMFPSQYFTVAPGQSEAVKFPIQVPYLFNKALVWRIVARAGDFSDGEENAMPVLTNRMLVTETLPLSMRGSGNKQFSFDNLLQSGSSETLQHQALTVEYTSNPAWYAVQALPYLMEYPYECAEQTWNRYYANSLATFIANSSPRIRQVFEQWKNSDTSALLSNLQKNQELKAILLEETPWVLQAKSEAEQKKNIALLFDMVKMSSQLNGSYEKLKQMQSSNGGFVWFKGGPDDRYITQYIVTGIGHLKKLKGIVPGQDDELRQILATAIPYLDKKIKEDYDNLLKSKTDLKKYTPGHSEIQYLYMRSFFPDYKIPAASQTAYNYFRSRLQPTWTQQNKYMQGMIALALARTGDNTTPAAILKSLKETAINNEELGIYWKDAGRSWWWYEAPVERQALLIEAFQEIGKDTKTADDLRTWLLKNKQTNKWESTKATAEACYALLLQGTSWLTNEPVVTISLGNTVIRSTDEKQQEGTGYFKTTIEGEKVKTEMGNITVNVATPGNTSSLSSGGVYWQYFEDLDKIKTAATPLSLVKKLFVETNSDRGPVLTPVNEGDVLKVGDKIKVRIELRVDREMEYVHMKDMRASCLEPVNVLSSYKWQDGLGYYESTKDASTNFFFSSLRRGTYVFEYPLFVTHTGNFSNGVTTIQCMYAPEFSSHSEGIRISVE